MTKDQVVAVAMRYAAILEEKEGCRPFKNPAAEGRKAKLEHIQWMCLEVPRLAGVNLEASMRWIGFIQGGLWILGVFDVEQVKDDNRPQAGPSDA